MWLVGRTTDQCFGTTYQFHPQGSRIQRKPIASIWGLYREECGQWKCLSTMVSANRAVASVWMEASVVVFLICYSAGLRLPLSYCFVVHYHLLIQYFPSSHFGHVSVLLCLSHMLEFLQSWSVSVQLQWLPLSPLSNHLLLPYWLAPYYFSLSTLFPIQTLYWGYRFSFGFSNPEDGTDTLS